MTRYAVFAMLIALVGFGCYDLGRLGAIAYERMLVERIAAGLGVLGIDWAEIRSDGLKLELHGHAPDLFERELALESARAAAPMARIESYATAALAPPEHRDPVRVELHRDERGVTLTGQTASREMRNRLNRMLAIEGPELTIHDLTGIQAQRPPRGWGPEIAVAALAASRLPNAYVVMQPGQVIVEGQAADDKDRALLTEALLERARDVVAVSLRLRVPAHVIAPFAFSAFKDAGGGIRLERCTARSYAEQASIAAALQLAGAEQQALPCAIGLGGPRGDWVATVRAGIDALTELPAGRVDIEYRSARLTAFPPTSPHQFQRVNEAFLSGIPDGFEGSGQVRADDVATRTEIARSQYWLRLHRENEQVILSGQAPSQTARTAIETYAAARFGAAQVAAGLQVVDAAPPKGWQSTAIKLLNVLAQTDAGDAEMAGQKIVLRTSVDDPRRARSLHDELLSAVPGYTLETRVTVDMASRFAALKLPPIRCAAELSLINQASPIDFDPGSAVIAAGSTPVLDKLAEQFQRCEAKPIEIGGHTDAKGSEQLNERLSQSRADAVVNALSVRGVPLRRMRAKGYGESVPIADNKTEEGRARNRRIEFKPPE